MKKNILITGIGGNVGQGILRNLRALEYDLRLIGTNVTIFSPGNHLCNKVYKLPYAYDDNYIPEMLKILEAESIDLIIPSTDFETVYLSKNSEILPPLACSPYATSQIFVDKYLTYLHFSKHDVPFLESWLPSEFQGDEIPFIVKPRCGRGSRDLFFSPKNLDLFSDNKFLVQYLKTGNEVTTAFYIGKYGDLIGHISMERELAHGTTVLAKVTHLYDEVIEEMIYRMVKTLEIRGSCNIQFIAENSKKIHPFEINGRISGTNSIRSQFGFEDVRWTIEELLFDQDIKKPKIINGIATRILVDVIYPELESIDNVNSNTKHIIF